MSSSEASDSADEPSDHVQAPSDLSDNSSGLVDQSDTESNESKSSSHKRPSRTSHNQQQPSPRKEIAIGRRRRGKSSRKHYSDRYLELFKETVAEFECGEDGVPSVDLLSTQIGAVQWQPSEKERLFNALSRKGRLDEPGLAMMVGKSELEIRDYLMFMREREAERHLFETQTKRVSHADIPAAVEISVDCENALEQAADALTVFQDQYDAAVAQQQHPGTASIDWDTARVLDEQVLGHEEAGSGSEDLSTTDNVPAGGLFRLSTWLELSEKIFMNPGSPQLRSNWHNIATEDERPALTYAAFSDFHDLTVSITRRLMQTCIFLAQSRIRSTKSQGYDPKPSVREQDVVAALDVLCMTRTLSDTWVGVARRNSLRVIQGSHDKGSRGSRVLTYDEVEKEMSKRKTSGRGRRSVSMASRSSTMSASGEDDVEDKVAHTAETGLGDRTSRDASPSLISMQDAESDVSMSDTDLDAEDSQADEYGGLSFHLSTSRQKRRQIYLEVQQDAYMEDLDRLRSEEEETRLWRLLGRDPPVTVKEEVEGDAGVRPKTLRKRKEDLADWQGTFAAEWEVFGGLVPKQDFVERGRPAKKPRLENELGQEHSNDGLIQPQSLPVGAVEHTDDEESGEGTTSTS